MAFERPEVTPEEAELDWHQQQLLEASLTDTEREYHRDMISCLEQQLANRKKAPQGRQLFPGENRGKSVTQRFIDWLIPARIWDSFCLDISSS
jgi:hypothetical protein